MKTKTLQEQYLDHKKSINQEFKKEYTKKFSIIVLFVIFFSSLAWYFILDKPIFVLLMFIIFLLALLVSIKSFQYITLRKNKEYKKLFIDYEQAQYLYNIEKNHTFGELSYESAWYYSFSW